MAVRLSLWNRLVSWQSLTLVAAVEWLLFAKFYAGGLPQRARALGFFGIFVANYAVKLRSAEFGNDPQMLDKWVQKSLMSRQQRSFGADDEIEDD